MAHDAARFRCLRLAPRGAGGVGPGPLRRSARGDSLGARATRPARCETLGRRSTRAQGSEGRPSEQRHDPRDVAVSCDISLSHGARRSMTLGPYLTRSGLRMDISGTSVVVAGSRGMGAARWTPRALPGSFGLPGSERAPDEGRFPSESRRADRYASLCATRLAPSPSGPSPGRRPNHDLGPRWEWAARRTARSRPAPSRPPGYDAAAIPDAGLASSGVLTLPGAEGGRAPVSAPPDRSARRSRTEGRQFAPRPPHHAMSAPGVERRLCATPVMVDRGVTLPTCRGLPSVSDISLSNGPVVGCASAVCVGRPRRSSADCPER